MAKKDYKKEEGLANVGIYRHKINGKYAVRLHLGGGKYQFTVLEKWKASDIKAARAERDRLRTQGEKVRTNTTFEQGANRLRASRKLANDAYAPTVFFPPYALALKERIQERKLTQGQIDALHKRPIADRIAELTESDIDAARKQKLADVTLSDVQAGLTNLLKSYQTAEDWTPGGRSYNWIKSWVMALLDLAVADKLLQQSPCPEKSLKFVTEVRKKRFVPNVLQYRQILASVRNCKGRSDPRESADFLEFIGECAVGQAETCYLRWYNIDWETGKIDFGRKKTRRAFIIPLHPSIRPMLERRFAEAKKRSNFKESDRIFSIGDPKRALSGACCRLWGERSKFSQRDIRAMRIREWWRAGVSIKQLAKWQGHGDGGVLILKTYTEIFAEGDQEEVEALAKIAAAACLDPWDVFVISGGVLVPVKHRIAKSEAEAFQRDWTARGATVEVRAAA